MTINISELNTMSHTYFVLGMAALRAGSVSLAKEFFAVENAISDIAMSALTA